MDKNCFDLNRLFGVELEVCEASSWRIKSALERRSIGVFAEGYNHYTRNYWKIVPDASLESSSGHACEIVSPPLSGTEGLLQLKEVVMAIREVGAKVNKTCGFHVHWNIPDFSGNQLKDLLYLYAKFEPVIDRLVSVSRRGDYTQHCRSLRKSGFIRDATDRQQMDWINRIPRGRSARDVSLHVNGGVDGRTLQRNHKVNVTSYISYGTVEFRHHQGTLNYAKASSWIVFTQAIVNRVLISEIHKSPTAKCTLGELIRTLKIADHHTDDPYIRKMREFVKRRYKELSTQNAED